MDYLNMEYFDPYYITSTLKMNSPTAVQLLSDTLSIFCIMSCLFLKVPQILFIRERRCAEGIHLTAMILEMFGFTIMTLYNYINQYAPMTYLEYPIILTQVWLLMYYVMKYRGMMKWPVLPLIIAIYFAAVFGYLLEILPICSLSYFVPFCTPLSSFAKIIYIIGMIKAKTARSVSLTTWIISMLTNLARIFTVYLDSADKTLMFNFFISAILSSGVLGTALYYQKIACSTPHREIRKSVRRRSHND